MLSDDRALPSDPALRTPPVTQAVAAARAAIPHARRAAPSPRGRQDMHGQRGAVASAQDAAREGIGGGRHARPPSPRSGVQTSSRCRRPTTLQSATATASRAAARIAAGAAVSGGAAAGAVATGGAGGTMVAPGIGTAIGVAGGLVVGGMGFATLTGCMLGQGWGLTETSPVATVMPKDMPFNGSIGLPVPSTEISIRDDDGNELPVGGHGEICVRGPQVMAGYWQRPDETAKVMLEITKLLEQIRGEKRPEVIFDPHTSELPRTGNFKKKR